MLDNLKNENIYSGSDVVSSKTSSIVALDHVEMGSIQLAYTVLAVSGEAFTSASIVASADTITISGHLLVQNLRGNFTITAADAFPTGLNSADNFYIIVVDANTIQIASALDGSAVDITKVSGNFVFVPDTFSGSIQLQVTNDNDGNSTWSDEGSASVITATGSTLIKLDRPGYNACKVVLTQNGGLMSALTMRVNLKG